MIRALRFHVSEGAPADQLSHTCATYHQLRVALAFLDGPLNGRYHDTRVGLDVGRPLIETQETCRRDQHE